MAMTIVLAIAAVLSGLWSLFLFSLGAPPRTPRRILAALFGLVSVQFLFAATQVNGVALLIAVRPVTAMVMAPLFYLHLAVTAREDARLERRDAVHFAGPVIIALAGQILGGRAVDLLGLLGLGVYVLLILALTGGGSARFEARGVQAAASLARWRWVVVILLAAMLLADSAITLDMVRRHDLGRSPAMLATGVIACLALGVGMVAILHRVGPVRWLFERGGRRDPDLQDAFGRLEAHMLGREPWISPDLTVARLGRQTGMPQRVVSAAVNRFSGQSFSRWVNGYRVRAAMDRLDREPERGLLDIMLDVGFQSKSNFNRAFREETGKTPSEWRRGGRADVG